MVSHALAVGDCIAPTLAFNCHAHLPPPPRPTLACMQYTPYVPVPRMHWPALMRELVLGGDAAQLLMTCIIVQEAECWQSVCRRRAAAAACAAAQLPTPQAEAVCGRGSCKSCRLNTLTHVCYIGPYYLPGMCRHWPLQHPHSAVLSHCRPWHPAHETTLRDPTPVPEPRYRNVAHAV